MSFGISTVYMDHPKYFLELSCFHSTSMIPYPVYSQKLLGFIPFGDFAWDPTYLTPRSVAGHFFWGRCSQQLEAHLRDVDSWLPSSRWGNHNKIWDDFYNFENPIHSIVLLKNDFGSLGSVLGRYI